MKQYTCQYIPHENDDILGYCLNLTCENEKSQFCLQCIADPMKHTNCKNDLKGFGQIENLITKLKENLDVLTNQLNTSFTQVNVKFLEQSKSIENMKKQLVKILDWLALSDYQQIKQNLQYIKEWYQYFNEQEEIIKQNQIGTQLNNVKRIIKALSFDLQPNNFQQNYENQLSQGIDLLNEQKWQQAYEQLSEIIKQSEKQQSLATFFQYISLYEMNQLSKGYQLREKSKKLNKSIFRDLLDYSDQELRKNPQNKILQIAKSYALNDEKQYQQAILSCEKVLNEEPQHLHSLYRKSYSLALINQDAQAIEILDKALKLNPNYGVAQFQKGYSLHSLQRYNDAIICYDNAIQLDPNYAIAYINKGQSLRKLQKYNDAINCYDKAIQLDPIYAMAYINKGSSLDDLKQFNEAIICYDKAIQLDPNYVQVYIYKANSLQ